MTSVSDLSQAQRDDLFNQVGDAMFRPGFNYDAHIAANTFNGVFRPPVHNDPNAAPPNPTPIPNNQPAPIQPPLAISTIAGLSKSELDDLYSQVGDAMFAPGFNYQAHIAGNTFNGVFRPPIYIPPDSSNLLRLPAVGTSEYDRLVKETGGASLNPGFNYAAHLAATVSQSRRDLSYDDVIRIILESGKTDFTSFDLEAYRESTGSWVGLSNQFNGPVIATVVASQLEQNVVLKMPEPGSEAYRALSIETGGASERLGFNYAAHVAAITSQKVLTELSYSEVMILIAETGRSSFVGFDLLAYQQSKQTAQLLLDRVLGSEVTQRLELPAAGTAEYEAILLDTGLSDLSQFDYKAYLEAKRDVEIALATIKGTAEDDVIVASSREEKNIFIAGDGNDSVIASNLNDIIIGGAGFDQANGGDGLDKAIFSGSRSEYAINLNQDDGIRILDSQESRDGADILRNIERLNFSDSSLALDVMPNQTAGAVYMLYQATFNRTPDASGIGYWISQVDNGADLTNQVANFFVSSEEFVSKYGSNPTNASYISNLYQNVLGRPGEQEGMAYWNAELDAGRVTKAAVLQAFATLPEGAQLVAPLIANGIVYEEWLG